jgi:hypothetical protein
MRVDAASVVTLRRDGIKWWDGNLGVGAEDYVQNVAKNGRNGLVWVVEMSGAVRDGNVNLFG